MNLPTANGYKPVQALIIHKTDDDDTNPYYVESAAFKEVSPGSFQMTQSKPLSEHSHEKLSKIFNQEKRIVFRKFKDSIIPPHILKVDQSLNFLEVAWYLIKPKRKLFFTEDLNVPDGEVKLPNLIFKLRGSSLSVYATKSKPQAATKLFRGPFHNTSSSSVCLGNASIDFLRLIYWEDIIAHAENAFFQTYFSYLHEGNPIKGNLNSVFTHCIKTGEAFPNDQLISINKTLNQVL